MTNRIRKSADHLEISLEVFLVKEEDYWVAVSPAVRVTGYGKTQAEAKKAFSVELDIFLEETEKRGTLEKLLLGYGWTLTRDAFTPPVTIVPQLVEGARTPSRYKSRFTVPAPAWQS